ncbi:hypothetical protein [Mycolicibacter virginiensis]|uniref:hypothetical protein n=1 Tax=Mycolicibacter virginiensis TaxID=1795032 RepID=UPI001F03DC8B|nr:hypothetical protein [Mycolicibacter virginiensis]ULP45931.1 hypothetical protein MJO54_13730 [Mycolicibacter virginiensis]
MTNADQPIVELSGIRVHPADSTGNNLIEFQGVPETTKAVRVPEDLAKRLTDLALHRIDLSAAWEFLDELDRHRPATSDAPPTSTATAIWHSALNTAMKCFLSSNARQKLSPDSIFGGTGPERETFDWLRHLRNKNIAHDDNDWMQAHPIAFIAQLGCEPKVIDVRCAVLQMATTCDENTAKLRMVIDRSLVWINAEYDLEHHAVIGALQSRDHQSLLALPEFSGAWPNNESIGRTR